jgi:hypothetical protein
LLERHHRELCEALMRIYESAGGPVSVPAFLSLCQPVIAPLLARRVSWNWVGARILAVHTAPDRFPDPDLPALTKRQVKYLVGAYSRIKSKTRPTETPQITSRPDTSSETYGSPPAVEIRTSDTNGGADPPAASDARSRIMKNHAVSKQLGHLEV